MIEIWKSRESGTHIVKMVHQQNDSLMPLKQEAPWIAVEENSCCWGKWNRPN